MKIFFEKDLKEIQEEKRNKNYIKQIQDLKNENVSLKKELELTQEDQEKFKASTVLHKENFDSIKEKFTL